MTQLPNDSKPTLQYRWQVQQQDENTTLVYYGLRNFPKHTKNQISLSTETALLLKNLDGFSTIQQIFTDLSSDCKNEITTLINEGVLVDATSIRSPATKNSNRTCIRCVNNDYVIPGLEFNTDGVCAFCQCYENVADSGPVHGGTITDEELLEASKNNPSRFDVMVLYTGGKDSSYLLWYLAKKLGLRVLAATWDLPFTNESSLNNMRAARYKLPNVEFIERSLPWDLVQKVSADLFDEVGLPCICPVISAVLLYPLAVAEKIPFVMDGVEAAQLIVLSKIMELPATSKARQLSDRELTIRQVKRYIKPNIDSGDPWDQFLQLIKDKLGRAYDPLEHALATTPSEELPLVKRLKSDEVYGSWNDVRTIIEKELDWHMPKGQKGLLHTSCDIETVKDYSQFRRFTDMRTRNMPQSIIEISAAVHFNHITREDGFIELSERGYYEPPQELDILLKKLKITPEGIASAPGELACICKKCSF